MTGNDRVHSLLCHSFCGCNSRTVQSLLVIAVIERVDCPRTGIHYNKVRGPPETFVPAFIQARLLCGNGDLHRHSPKSQTPQ